jgi:lysylphosphatidylglycerol synthetase-like protein (DUF2156 family)
MRLRTFYTIAILFPLLVLAAVAALGGGDRGLPSRLPPGTTTEWLYPTASVRSLAAYTMVAVWLLWELHRRTPSRFAPLLWLLPLVNTGVNILVLAPFILVHGAAHELFVDEGLQVALRLVVRLLIGFAYVGLVVYTRNQLREGGALRTDDSA